MGAVSDIDYNRCAGYVQQQEEFQNIDLVEGQVVPFLNIHDKGYRGKMVAWKNGKQKVLQPEYANSASFQSKIRKKTRKITISLKIELQRRESCAMLCRVCRWDESGGNKDVEPLDKDPLKMQVSLTNRRDLKSFVVANLRSFMVPGGCALFLETVMHIHGLPRLHRMLCEARGIACKNMCSFINYNCEKKLKEEWDDFLRKRKIDSSIRQKDWTEPLCRDCVAPELLSILLTGKPNADMKDWVAEKFGIGVLSGAVVEEQRAVNASLISPQHPVWMIEEDNSYSVMWNEDNEETETAALGHDSFSFKLNCWKCWDEDLERGIYRIIPGRRNPSALAGSSDPITKMDVDQTIVNPDDELNYRDFRRWRYAFGVTCGTDH
jgi:hypothetical protein|eukprot:scaffold692_cov181-Chaetoceros_neogracile.AAC.3